MAFAEFSRAIVRHLAPDFADGLTTSAEGAPEFELALSCYPNPFNPSTTIVFTLPETAPTQLAVFDVRGRRIALLCQETLPAGKHEIRWNGQDDDGRSVAAGVYFSRLTAGDRTLTQRMALLK